MFKQRIRNQVVVIFNLGLTADNVKHNSGYVWRCSQHRNIDLDVLRIWDAQGIWSGILIMTLVYMFFSVNAVNVPVYAIKICI